MSSVAADVKSIPVRFRRSTTHATDGWIRSWHRDRSNPSLTLVHDYYFYVICFVDSSSLLARLTLFITTTIPFYVDRSDAAKTRYDVFQTNQRTDTGCTDQGTHPQTDKGTHQNAIDQQYTYTERRATSKNCAGSSVSSRLAIPRTTPNPTRFLGHRKEPPPGSWIGSTNVPSPCTVAPNVTPGFRSERIPRKRVRFVGHRIPPNIYRELRIYWHTRRTATTTCTAWGATSTTGSAPTRPSQG